MDVVAQTSKNFRYRALKLAVAFTALWLLILSGAFLAASCAASADARRLNTLPEACTRPALPLRVAFEVDTADRAPSVLYAAQAWSDAIGKPAFVAAAAGEDYDVIVVDAPIDQAHPTWDAEVVTAKGEDGRCYKKVSLMATPADSVTEFYLYAHELGHALDLKDSEDPTSLMNHFITAGLMGGEGGPDAEDDPPLPTIKPVDIATVLAVFRSR